MPSYLLSDLTNEQLAELEAAAKSPPKQADLQKWEDIVSIHEVKGGMSTTALKKCLAEGSIVETAHHAQWLFDDAIRQRVHDAYMTHAASLYSKENNYGRDIPHEVVKKK